MARLLALSHTGRIIASVILILAALVASKSLWLKQGFSASFAYEAQKELVVQIFYSRDTPFVEKDSVSVKIREGKGKSSIYIPTRSKIKVCTFL